jgi:hypothetical protein
MIDDVSGNGDVDLGHMSGSSSVVPQRLAQGSSGVPDCFACHVPMMTAPAWRYPRDSPGSSGSAYWPGTPSTDQLEGLGSDSAARARQFPWGNAEALGRILEQC